MAIQQQLFATGEPLPPLTVEDISYNPFALPIPEWVLQLQVDTLNALEGRVSMSMFTPERQEEIKTYYRFSAIRQNSKSHNVAHRTGDTMDIVL